jgi:ACS family tartrate transporter-like MFS transporter
LLLTAYSSDRFRERVWHAALPLYASAVCTVLMLVSGEFIFAYLMIGCSIMGIYAGKSPTWAVATEWLPADMKAVGIAQVNAVSSLISFFPIYIVGMIRGAGGSFALAFLPMALISAAGASILLYMNHTRSRAGTGVAATRPA